MSALSGSLSYARFFAPRALPRDFLDRSHAAILHHAMRPLTPDEPDAERSGWCALGDPLDVSLPPARIYLDGYVNLGFRTDRWAIPGPLLRTRVREAEAAYREKQGRERLGRRERAEIKEVVTRELRKKLVPTTRVVDLTWSLEEGVVRFFSHTERTSLAMLELFQKTFAVELVAESPYTLAPRLELGDEEAQAWESLEMTVLAPRGAGPSQSHSQAGGR
jgi:recombination associated protein RdgC